MQHKHPFLFIARKLVLSGAFLLTTPISPLLAGDRSESPVAIPVLLDMGPVRQELNLTPLQCSLLDDIHRSYKKRASQISAIGQADTDASLRANWDIRDLRKKYNERAYDVLSPSQQERLKQIQRQMFGGSLLTSLSEQKLLGLSQQQQQSLAAIHATEVAQLTALSCQNKAGQLSDFWKGIKQGQLQQQTSRQMLAVLSPEQKKRWEILTGRKSDLPVVHDPNARTKSLFEGY